MPKYSPKLRTSLEQAEPQPLTLKNKPRAVIIKKESRMSFSVCKFIKFSNMLLIFFNRSLTFCLFSALVPSYSKGKLKMKTK